MWQPMAAYAAAVCSSATHVCTRWLCLRALVRPGLCRHFEHVGPITPCFADIGDVDDFVGTYRLLCKPRRGGRRLR